MTLKNELHFEDYSSDFLKTKNSSLAMLCKGFQEKTLQSTIDDSILVVSLLLCQIDSMIKSCCNEVEISFSSVEIDKVLVYGDSKINLELEIIGVTDSEKSDDYFCESDIENIDNSDLKIGIRVKNKVRSYMFKYKEDEDLTQYIFTSLLEFVNNSIIGENFIMVMPIGNFVVKVRFTSVLERIKIH